MGPTLLPCIVFIHSRGFAMERGDLAGKFHTIVSVKKRKTSTVSGFICCFLLVCGFFFVFLFFLKK